jgi:NADPH2:quinone reductase
MRFSGGCPGTVGGWAEHALTIVSFTARRPDGLSPEAAAALPVAAATAYDAMNRFDLPVGSTLLVNGAGGGVGVPAVQLAKARGLQASRTGYVRQHPMGSTPSSEARAALELVEQGHATGKVVLIP